MRWYFPVFQWLLTSDLWLAALNIDAKKFSCIELINLIRRQVDKASGQTHKQSGHFDYGSWLLE